MAFSFRAGTNWCHDFPKLARESGFYFNMHGSRVRVDWNRISAIDIDRMIRERDFLTVDENINNVIDYCLENEYDVKILDSNFVKLFRLAQLSVEYLLYCKQYLDHSVIILKDELRSKIEQNVNMKKEIATLEDTIKSLKERSKDKYKLIEARLGESNGEIYKCPHCPKTFVSAMFVNAHVARRHSYISDMRISISPVHEHYRTENEKLHNEIKTLKERLNQTERVIRSESDKLLDRTERDYDRNMSGIEYDVNKVERLREQNKYQEDIGSLKNILFDEIRALREKEHTLNESILEANVKTLISQQEKEIENLRNQLLERLTPGIENMQMKLQAQENYWKAKLEDMEGQHHTDIEKLTTELKATQQAADYIKSEYSSKVHDLEKQSMDQSNILVEQGKQLSCLSREINNSQTQYNNHRTKEKDTIVQYRESPLLKIKHDTMYNHDDNQIYHKDLSNIKNDEIVIEDVGSETSQEYDKLESFVARSRYMPNREDTMKNKDIKKFMIDSKTAKLAIIKSDLKDSDRSETAMEIKNTAKHRDALKDRSFIDKTSEYTAKIFDTRDLENVSVNTAKQHIRNVERRTGDTRNSKSFLKKSSISSMTESEYSSSMSQSESDSESITMDDDVTVKKYEISSAIKSPNMKKALIQEDARNMFDNRLRDLGIDPEWQDIPTATFKQKMEIIRHQQNINAKKLVHYNRIKQKILEDVLQRISANHKEFGNAQLTKKSSLDKKATHVKSKALKAFNTKDNDQYVSVQKAENTTPSKLRVKQKIELLPRKYKDEETFENTCESPLTRSKADVYTSPKVISTQLRLLADQCRSASQDVISASSIENSPEKIKQISSKKITVLDNIAHKIGSPISRKQMVTSKFSENNDSDSTIIQQKDSVVSPKNNKSSLKLTSGSMGSLVKKKVLFDLEYGKNDVTVPENDQRTSHDNDWNILSSPERRDYTLQKEKSMSTGNIILKTSQSDKIAEISKKIQEQLSIVRKPPVGSIETIFRSNINLEDLPDHSTKNRLLRSTSLASSILENPVQNSANPTAKSNMFPQPAPRTLKDKDYTTDQSNNKLSALKYSDLDSDIDEILQIE